MTLREAAELTERFADVVENDRGNGFARCASLLPDSPERIIQAMKIDVAAYIRDGSLDDDFELLFKGAVQTLPSFMPDTEVSRANELEDRYKALKSSGATIEAANFLASSGYGDLIRARSETSLQGHLLRYEFTQFIEAVKQLNPEDISFYERVYELAGVCSASAEKDASTNAFELQMREDNSISSQHVEKEMREEASLVKSMEEFQPSMWPITTSGVAMWVVPGVALVVYFLWGSNGLYGLFMTASFVAFVSLAALPLSGLLCISAKTRDFGGGMLKVTGTAIYWMLWAWCALFAVTVSKLLALIGVLLLGVGIMPLALIESVKIGNWRGIGIAAGVLVVWWLLHSLGETAMVSAARARNRTAERESDVKRD